MKGTRELQEHNRGLTRTRRPALPLDFEVLALAVLTFLTPFYRVLPQSISSAWLISAMAIIIFGVLTRNVSSPAFPGVWIFAVFATMVAILTATNEVSMSDNLAVGTQLVAFMGLGVFFFRDRVRKKRCLLIVLPTTFAVAQTLSSAAAVAQVLGSTLFGYVAVNGRAPGLNGHPNVLGLMSGVVLLLCLSILWGRPGKFTAFITVALIVNACGLVSSGSLSSLTSVVLGVVLLALVKRVKRKQLGVASLAISVASLALVFIGRAGDLLRTPTDRFRQVTGQTNAIGTVEVRGSTYQFALERIKQSPLFGSGLDAETAQSFNGTTVVHNFVLRSWFQGGALLGLAAVAIMLTVLTIGIQAFRTGSNGTAASILLTISAFALTSAFFDQGYYWAVFLIAYAAVDYQTVRTSGSPAQPSPGQESERYFDNRIQV